MKKIKGRGKLVPTRLTGISYRVTYGLSSAGDPFQAKKGHPAMRWTNCVVRCSGAGRLPDGSYYLYTDEGRVHQVKSIDGRWLLLAAAA